MPFRFLRFLALFALCGGASALAQQPQAVVLQYHHISTETPRSTSVNAEEFRQHMEYLRDNGFTVLPLEEVLQALQQHQELPAKTAVLTFDDGYRSVFDVAYPLLRDYGWPFTIFVPTGLITATPGLYASWDQLREMGEHGATLANHTVSHPYLLDRSAYADEAAWRAGITREITEAEARLEQETGQSHHIFAYPYGEFDATIQQLVSELGYVALAQNSGAINAASDFSALPRFPFSGIYASLRTYTTKVNARAFNVTREPASPITTEQAPEVILDFDGDYRLDALSCFHNDQPMTVTAVDAGAQQYRLQSPSRSTSRRFHYNCTAPGPDGRYYWYSVLWINPDIAE
ncbi:MAG TPA: polysaccharide deacetylase family protein [Hyphomicrobiales bacterium]|nr:polysaccharide deacetylase family protein [Hyphomicrobiales bacterium]